MRISSLVVSSLCAWQLGTDSLLLTSYLCVGRAPWQPIKSYTNDYTFVGEKVVSVK
jgi:hypothetical protein